MSSVTAIELPNAVAKNATSGGARRKRIADSECYLAGPENRLVVSAIEKLLQTASDGNALPPVGWNIVTLVGPTGCGKSLLAGGIAAAWRRSRGEESVLVLSAIDLRRRLDEAIENQTTGEFRDRLRSVQLLVIEDLHRLPSASHVVNELSETVDALRDRNGLLLATSLKPFTETVSFDRQLISRFAAGLTLDVAPPAAETRAALLGHVLSASGCRLDTAAAGDLAASLSGDARRVLQAANRLRERFGVRRPIGSEQVRAYLKEEQRPVSPPLRSISPVVARYYGMSVREMRSSSRKKPIVHARAVAIYLARELTPLSYEEIGQYFGGRDHTTIMHNFQRIESSLHSDQALRSAITELRLSVAS